MSGSSSSSNQLSNDAMLAALNQRFDKLELALAEVAASKRSTGGKSKAAAPPAINGGTTPLQASGVVSTEGAVANIPHAVQESKKSTFPNINIYFKTSTFAEQVPECVKELARKTAGDKAGWLKADAPTQAKKVCNEYWGALTTIKDSGAEPDKAVAVAFHAQVAAEHKLKKDAHTAALTAASVSDAAAVPASQMLCEPVNDNE